MPAPAPEHVVICDADGVCVYACPRGDLIGHRLNGPDPAPWTAAGLPAGTAGLVAEHGSLARILGQTRRFPLGGLSASEGRYNATVRPLSLGGSTGTVLHLETVVPPHRVDDGFATHLLDTHAVAAMLIDPVAGVCLRATAGLTALLDAPPERFTALPAHHWFLRPGDYDRLLAAVDGAPAGDRIEVTLIDANGEPRTVLAAGERVPHDGQEAVLTAFVDIGEYRRLVNFTHQDALTALPNRNQLHDRLALAMETAGNTSEKVAVLFLDLDGFKAVNDEHGHAIGDRVLRCVADRLSRAVRRYDTVARVGGDEFVVMLERMTADDQAERVSANLRGVLARPVTVDTLSLQLGASVGIALFPEDGSDADTLLRRADDRMYREKAARTPPATRTRE